MMNRDPYWSEILADDLAAIDRRTAFDRETEELRGYAFRLFLACCATCCAIGAVARCFL